MPQTRLAQVDGIRTIAVGLVLIQHLAGYTTAIQLGHRGVSLFFVLSGFLITDILIGFSEKIEQGVSFSSQWWKFFVHRLSRIFPLYYGVVIVFAVILNLEEGRQYVWWLLTYTENIKISITGSEPHVWSIYWTLGIEEWFYLIWPFVIFWPSMRLRIGVSLACLFVGIAWKVWAYQHWNAVAMNKFNPACFDSLALGALLSMAHRWRPDWIKHLWKLALVGLVGYACLWFPVWRWDNALFERAFSDVCLGIGFCWLISHAYLGSKSLLNGFLSLQPVAYIGRISYGIYVYHLIVYYGWFETWQPGWKLFAMVAPLTISASAISFRLFETKIQTFINERFANGTPARMPRISRTRRSEV